MSTLEKISEEELRRFRFTGWLVEAWQWAVDEEQTKLAATLTEIIAHSGEEDYPLWEMARKQDVIGNGRRATMLYKRFGMPPMGPHRSTWEKEIWFSPVIYLDEKLWNRIYRALGWANRTSDDNLNAVNFFLWSPAGNPVRFVMQRKVEVIDDDRETDSTA